MTKSPDDPLGDLFPDPNYPEYEYNPEISITENGRKAITHGVKHLWAFLRDGDDETKRKAVTKEFGPSYVYAINRATRENLHTLKTKNIAPHPRRHWRDVLREEYQSPYGKGLFVDEAALAQFEQCVSSHYEGDHMRAARQLINDTMRLKGGPQDINKWLMKWCGNHERSGGNIL